MLDTIELYWPEGKPSQELEDLVVADIRKWLGEDLDSADELLFHTVFLDNIENEDSPSVSVWGVEGDSRFHCQYHTTNVAPKFKKGDLPEHIQKLMWPDEEDE